MMKRSDKIFPGSEIHSGLAAERAVDLCERSSRNAGVADAAHVNGSEEAGHVSDDAATEGQQHGVAISALLSERFQQTLDGGEAFVLLAGGDLQQRRWMWQAGEKQRAVQLPDLR